MEQKAIYYLDNAASSWPKPESVIQAVKKTLEEEGANPGRSAHSLSINAARIICDAREAVAGLFGKKDPLRVVFTKNATESLNIVIKGLLRPGDHVITTSMEHNSVMRPLHWVKASSIDRSVISCSASGELDPEDVKKAIRKETKLIITTHASNVTGTIIPISEVGAIAKAHGIAFCVDAAQTAGCLPIDVGEMNIDLLVFTGHKSLYGPQGTGGLYIAQGLDARINPLITGGTGSSSEHEEQPDFLPDKYESGTPNTPGIAGMLEGLRFIESKGIDCIRSHEMDLADRLTEGLRTIKGIRVYGPTGSGKKVAIVSFTISGMDPAIIAFKLDEEYGIMARPGLHCAPCAHRTIGTFPHGTIRLSPGCFNTTRDVDMAIHAVSRIAQNKEE